MRAARALALLLLAPAARGEEACPANRAPPLVLPRLKAAIANGQEVTIVALGSSSTQGWHASDLAHSYPAELQAGLSAALPTAHIAVLNRGIGGQDVTEELPRMERDVIFAHPQVVIWQVGANGAMRHMPPDLFKRLLATGVHRLQEANLDVVLMDNQRAPNILAAPEHVKIDQAMADVAASAGIGLFARGVLMDQWRDSGFPYDRFVSEDGVHHNDHGYRCVAEALVRAIVEGLGEAPKPPNAVAARK